MDEDNVDRATTFSGDEAPDGERLDGSESLSEYYQRLSALNSLRWTGKWRNEARERQIDRTATLDSVASQLSLTTRQKERARRYFSNIPTAMQQGYQKPLLALSICAVVGHEDGRKYHPENMRQDRHHELSRLAHSIGVSFREFSRCWHDVREEVSE